MPRRPRCELPDGAYHVTVRGTGGTRIFLDDRDRALFTRLLVEVTEKFGVHVHAWCLLGTHFHLIVECRLTQLSSAMHRLNGMYAQRFNGRHERRGHLFEQRYSAWVIETEEHLYAAILYVINNPVAAGLCRDSTEWIWSWPRLQRSIASDAAARTRGLSLGQVPK